MEVRITDNGRVVASLKIEPIDSRAGGELVDYRVTMHSERGDDVLGMHRRRLDNFPAGALNYMGPLRAALNLFPPDAFGNEDAKATVPTDMERRLNRALPAIPAWLSRLRDYRSTLRGGQPEQFSDDGGGKGERSED